MADNAVLTSKIADNAVLTSKIADNSVTAAKITDGAVTPFTGRVSRSVIIPIGEFRELIATCPVGQDVTGGGYQIGDGTFDVDVLVTANGTSGDSWRVVAHNSETRFSSQVLFVHAICLRIAS